MPELAQRQTLRTSIEEIIRTSLFSQRANANLMRALNHYTDTHPNARFSKKVHRMSIHTIRRCADFLLLKRDEMKHPDPDIAVPFALLTVGLAIREIILLDKDSRDWATVMPKDDYQLLRELTRVFLSYLGIK
jgi:hypothetical protein